MATPQATASASQRRCHAPYIAIRSSVRTAFMVLAGSERALGDDDHVARHQLDVGPAGALLEQIGDAQRVFLLLAGIAVEADQAGAVARGVLAQAPDRDH